MEIVTATPFPPAPPLRAAIRASCRIDESEAVARILAAAELPAEMRDRIADRARALVAAVRRERLGKGGIDAFLHEYALSSPEGVALLCLAEALLRVPDAETVDRLIRDKIGEANWESHLGRSESIFVNASTWALMLTGRLLHAEPAEPDLRGALRRLVARSGEPVVRQAVTAAMRILGRQFVIGRTIEEAIEHAREAERHGYRHSYDMLGEAARTAADAARYFAAYDHAIAAIGRSAADRDIAEAPGISVKLSALHPRYEMAQRDRVLRGIVAAPARARAPRPARPASASRSTPKKPIASNCRSISSRSWRSRRTSPAGTGSASPSRPIRSEPCRSSTGSPILPRRGGRRLMVRLVKGAYWDSEIKRAQERGLDGYPVYTRKVATDVSYLACAQPAARPRRRRSIRNSRRTTRIPWRRFSKWPAIAGIGSSSACTAWGRRSTNRSSAPSTWTGRAGSMRRSAVTRICSPIWCGGCSKTAPTPRSSTASSTTGSRSTRSSPTRSRASRNCRSSRIPASRCRATFTGRSARMRPGST